MQPPCLPKAGALQMQGCNQPGDVLCFLYEALAARHSRSAPVYHRTSQSKEGWNCHPAAARAVTDVLLIVVQQLMLRQQLLTALDGHRAARAPARQPCPEGRHNPTCTQRRSPENIMMTPKDHRNTSLQWWHLMCTHTLCKAA